MPVIDTVERDEALSGNSHLALDVRNIASNQSYQKNAANTTSNCDYYAGSTTVVNVHWLILISEIKILFRDGRASVTYSHLIPVDRPAQHSSL